MFKSMWLYSHRKLHCGEPETLSLDPKNASVSKAGVDQNVEVAK